jgi:protein-tyrosine phosphatase
MAEGLARQKLGEAMQVSSAGIEAWEGAAASVHALEVLKEHDIDFSNHRSKRITAEMIEKADWIIPMTRVQQEKLMQRYPQFAPKIRYLGDWSDKQRDIRDPWMGSLEDYRRTAQEIQELLDDLKKQLSLN